MQNLDLDSASSITSRELADFDIEKLLEFAFEKDQLLGEEKFYFTSFNKLTGLDESDGDRHQDEKDKLDHQDSKRKQKDKLLSIPNQMEMLISKIAQLNTFVPPKSIFKRERRQLKKWTHQMPAWIKQENH